MVGFIVETVYFMSEVLKLAKFVLLSPFGLVATALLGFSGYASGL